MRITKKRKQILDVLESSNHSYTVQEIASKLEDIDLATVYRSINAFVESGLVRELKLSKTESSYEINNNGHEHALCRDCGKVLHVDIDKKQLLEGINIPGFDIDDVEIVLKGKCSEVG